MGQYRSGSTPKSCSNPVTIEENGTPESIREKTVRGYTPNLGMNGPGVEILEGFETSAKVWIVVAYVSRSNVLTDADLGT